MIRACTLAVLALCLSGCGGSGGSAAKPSAGAATTGGGSSAAAPQQTSASGMPDWVARGSGAVKSSASRVFYGVGSAAGIRNPALLRTTADDRARAEIGKIFEVYSASLMKDWMSNHDGQVVEQAIKTMSASRLTAVEIVDHYIAQDGSLYALAQLDLARVAAVLAAKKSGVVKTFASDPSLERIFDKHSTTKTPAEKPPIRADESVKSEPAPATATSSAKERSGDRPPWVDGPDPAFPHRTFLCAVGVAGERSASENSAYTAIARIFSAKVVSVATDFMAAYQRTGAQTLEVQSSESLTKVSVDELLSGVEIRELWQGEGKWFALACIDRAKAARSLKEKIAAADTTARSHIDAATKATKAGRVRELAKALETLAQRAALNGELRIIDPDGIGVAATLSHVDVAVAFDAAVAALNIGVVVEGPHSDELRDALMEGLTDRGYEVSDGPADGMDVLITTKVRMEKVGKGSGRIADVNFARAVIQIKIKDVARGKILATLKESRKEGHRSLEEAQRWAVRKLAKKLVGKVGAEIERSMLGT